MAKDHGPSVKDDKQYEGLRKKGMSKERAATIANTPTHRARAASTAGAAARARAARAAARAAAATAPRSRPPAARAARRATADPGGRSGLARPWDLRRPIAHAHVFCAMAIWL